MFAMVKLRARRAFGAASPSARGPAPSQGFPPSDTTLRCHRTSHCAFVSSFAPSSWASYGINRNIGSRYLLLDRRSPSTGHAS